MGVSATWMTCATKSSDESVPRKLGILLPLERNAISELGIEVKRILRLSLERRKIDMNQAKPSAIPERPLEIVEQGPDEITAHRHPGGDRVEHRSEIPPEIRNPRFVPNPADGNLKEGRPIFVVTEGPSDLWLPEGKMGSP